jgi:hypothetical protein
MNYVQWTKGESGTPFDFYTDGEIKKLYKRNIRAMLNRRNTKNGRLYKEDPTIMCVLRTCLASAYIWIPFDVSSSQSESILCGWVGMHCCSMALEWEGLGESARWLGCGFNA